MKALPTSPAAANAFNLASAPAPSLLSAQTKAQRLRTHAQEKRGNNDGFKDHLQTRQKSHNANGDLTRKPEHANESPTDGPKGAEETSKEAAASQQGADAQNKATLSGAAQQDESQGAEVPQNTTEAAEQAAEKPTEPFLQEIVAQVLQGVDPALKLKPSAVARATGTVSGNAFAAMKSIGVECGGGDGAADAGSAEVSQSAVIEHEASAAEFVAPAGRPRDAESKGEGNRAASASQTAAKPDGQQSTATDSAQSASERASNAVNSTAAAINPTAADAPSRAVESRVTLTPTLTAVSAGTAATGGPAAQAAATKDAPPPPPFAQQVQHGLEVAMYDLPAPAGDRLVTLKLNPSALGSLRIALHVSGDAVHVRFQVGSAKAKASIGKSMEDLKAAIGRQGLRVESMEVEEDRALAALTGPSLDENGQGSGPAVTGAGQADAGKGFAQLLDAPHGPDGSRAADGQGRTPNQTDAEIEGGVLQVLTFRLDAVG